MSAAGTNHQDAHDRTAPLYDPMNVPWSDGTLVMEVSLPVPAGEITDQDAAVASLMHLPVEIMDDNEGMEAHHATVLGGTASTADLTSVSAVPHGTSQTLESQDSVLKTSEAVAGDGGLAELLLVQSDGCDSGSSRSRQPPREHPTSRPSSATKTGRTPPTPLASSTGTALRTLPDVNSGKGLTKLD